MTRERHLGRPGQAKKLTFECPEVMQEEKSLPHFSLIKQEALEVQRQSVSFSFSLQFTTCNGQPYSII